MQLRRQLVQSVGEGDVPGGETLDHQVLRELPLKRDKQVMNSQGTILEDVLKFSLELLEVA